MRGPWGEIAAVREVEEPACWRRPFSSQPFTSDEIFSWIAEAWRAGPPAGREARLRLHGPAGLVPFSADHAPAPEDASMRGWLERLERAHGECGVVVNDVQGATPEAWARMREILADARDALGAGYGASFEVFAGAYRRGAFGVHKDDQDVITFVLEGKKRFRLWPYERFATRPEVAPGSELLQVGLSVDPAAERDGSVVLEGEPGDVFFWPAEWWHVAESDGVMCTSVGLGLFRNPPPALDDDDRAEEQALATASAFGCKTVPPALAVELPRAPLRSVPGAVRWTLSRDTVVWSAGGEAFRYPAAPAIVETLRRVASGRRFVPADLVAELADDEVAPDALEHIVHLVHASHALVVAR
jgi:hypothetical protein